MRNSLTSVVTICAAITISTHAQTRAPCSGDLNQDGDVNGADVGLLLLQWGPCDGAALGTLHGQVVDPTGNAVAKARVASSTGQVATTDDDGVFSLLVEVEEAGEDVLITVYALSETHPLVGVVRQPSLMPGDQVDLGLVSLIQYAVGCTESQWMNLCVGMPDSDAYIAALAVFDDGTGPALYAGGRFTSAGGAQAQNIARWNGSSWESPSDTAWTVNGRDPVSAMAVFDDGSGAALYIGTTYFNFQAGPLGYIVRWNGASWSGPPFSWNGGPVRGLFTHDDGTAAALLAGGGREIGGSQPYSFNHVLRYGGSDTLTFSNPLSNYPHNHHSARVHCFATFDDGNGPALYMAGKFPSAVGGAQYSIAKWDGQAWSGVGGGVPAGGGGGCCPWGAINAMAVFDDGTGSALYVAGSFTSAGSSPATNVAKWDGKEWSAVGDGVPGPVHALAVFDDGSGQTLYAGGSISIAGVGGVPLLRLEGDAWVPVEGVLDGPTNALLTVAQPGGPGDGLYVGGDFSVVGGSAANCVIRRACD